jgi:transcriptional regulator
MYLPSHFEETRVDVLHALIREHSLGMLVTNAVYGLEANHIPFELDPEPAPFGTLRCHVARANPVWQSMSGTSAAMIVFRGVEAYVSPSWYATKHQHGKVVPTWNYAAVHAYGTPRVITDPVWLRTLVQSLTDRYEATRVDRWRVADAPAEYVDKMLTAIVGIEVPITRLIGKLKLSQNRTPADRAGVVTGLRREGDESGVRMAQLIQDLKVRD